MRRSELACDDPVELATIMARGDVGYLGMIDPQGYPRVVPLNFTFLDGQVYFHGATEGEKYAAFESQPHVTFAVVTPQVILPSHWFTPESACPATAFYKSVHIRGQGRLIDDLEEKARALQSIMEKYQPEGGHKPITAADSLYTSALRNVAVFGIDPRQIDVKVKLGGHLGETKRRMLIERLRDRNRGDDREVADLMSRGLADRSRPA
ncbi:MAG: flavin-nucleotide-binding protein [bacterium]|nr:flavin-nucleotide-binding protein [bacterium]